MPGDGRGPRPRQRRHCGAAIAGHLQFACFAGAGAGGLETVRLPLSDLDDRIPPAIASGGVQHLVLALASRDKLRAMRYELGAGRSLMQRYGLTTISLVHAETPQRFHARNRLRRAACTRIRPPVRQRRRWPAICATSIGRMAAHRHHQGEDMGAPCHLQVQISDEAGSSIRVSGKARMIGESQSQSHFFNRRAISPDFSSCSMARCTRWRTAGSTCVPMAM
jgi:hypothetical protein